MFLPLTENYITTVFYQNCGKPTYSRAQKIYQGSCPICREGSSWLKKRRCYYIPNNNAICCHNCGWYSNPYKWIAKVTNKSFSEIKADLESNDGEVVYNSPSVSIAPPCKVSESLPLDSINLFDKKQALYYKDNWVVKSCLDLMVSRRLDKAINRPTAFYTSLVDKVHTNRLIIPFYFNGKPVFYQSRTVMLDDTRPKYLSRVGAEKSLYGIDNIDTNLDYIFLIEGPIDAMFVKNGVALAGINESGSKNFTPTQLSQLSQYPLHKKIWLLDNQQNDNTSRAKSKKLLDAGETVFIWPESLSMYKDVNDYCVDKGVNAFDTDIILTHSHAGLKGKLIITNN